MDIHDVALGVFSRLAPMQSHLELSEKTRAKATLAYDYAEAFMAAMDEYIAAHPEAARKAGSSALSRAQHLQANKAAPL